MFFSFLFFLLPLVDCRLFCSGSVKSCRGRTVDECRGPTLCTSVNGECIGSGDCVCPDGQQITLGAAPSCSLIAVGKCEGTPTACGRAWNWHDCPRGCSWEEERCSWCDDDDFGCSGGKKCSGQDECSGRPNDCDYYSGTDKRVAAFPLISRGWNGWDECTDAGCTLVQTDQQVCDGSAGHSCRTLDNMCIESGLDDDACTALCSTQVGCSMVTNEPVYTISGVECAASMITNVNACSEANDINQCCRGLLPLRGDVEDECACLAARACEMGVYTQSDFTQGRVCRATRPLHVPSTPNNHLTTRRFPTYDVGIGAEAWPTIGMYPVHFLGRLVSRSIDGDVAHHATFDVSLASLGLPQPAREADTALLSLGLYCYLEGETPSSYRCPFGPGSQHPRFADFVAADGIYLPKAREGGLLTVFAPIGEGYRADAPPFAAADEGKYFLVPVYAFTPSTSSFPDRVVRYREYGEAGYGLLSATSRVFPLSLECSAPASSSDADTGSVSPFPCVPEGYLETLLSQFTRVAPALVLPPALSSVATPTAALATALVSQGVTAAEGILRCTCGIGGVCVAGNCVCRSGFSGVNCDTTLEGATEFDSMVIVPGAARDDTWNLDLTGGHTITLHYADRIDSWDSVTVKVFNPTIEVEESLGLFSAFALIADPRDGVAGLAFDPRPDYGHPSQVVAQALVLPTQTESFDRAVQVPGVVLDEALLLPSVPWRSRVLQVTVHEEGASRYDSGVVGDPFIVQRGGCLLATGASRAGTCSPMCDSETQEVAPQSELAIPCNLAHNKCCRHNLSGQIRAAALSPSVVRVPNGQTPPHYVGDTATFVLQGAGPDVGATVPVTVGSEQLEGRVSLAADGMYHVETVLGDTAGGAPVTLLSPGELDAKLTSATVNGHRLEFLLASLPCRGSHTGRCVTATSCGGVPGFAVTTDTCHLPNLVCCANLLRQASDGFRVAGAQTAGDDADAVSTPAIIAMVAGGLACCCVVASAGLALVVLAGRRRRTSSGVVPLARQSSPASPSTSMRKDRRRSQQVPPQRRRSQQRVAQPLM